jgi:hypothetical protein
MKTDMYEVSVLSFPSRRGENGNFVAVVRKAILQIAILSSCGLQTASVCSHFTVELPSICTSIANLWSRTGFTKCVPKSCVASLGTSGRVKTE